MQPRTKLQKEIIEKSKKLTDLTEYQKSQIWKHVVPHIAKHNSKGVYTCMDCGKSWKGDKANNVVCPHCSSKLKVEDNRKRKYVYKDYFAIVLKVGRFQVIRMFLMSAELYKGKPASWRADEAFQRWITSDCKSVIVSRSRYFPCRYYDSWDWSSYLEIRHENYGHSVSPYKIIGHISAIPELKRNGLKGSFHGKDPYKIIKGLLTNSKIETMWKAGQFELADYFSNSSYLLEEYWPSIKIAIRNNYIIKDASLWNDLLSALGYLHKDIHNPKFICPKSLKDGHDYWIQKRQAKEEKINRMTVRQREMNQEWEYLSDSITVAKDERKYRQEKSKYFDLEFKDKEVTVRPLVSVKEFIDEWHTMHHCVFTNKYYQKEKSLILHALVDGISVATIEIDIDSLTILQCRGPHNSVPPLKEKIIALIEKNKSKIAQKRVA